MKDLLVRPIAFHPVLARLFGGINEAVYWQQLHYWSDKGKRPDGFIYKTKEKIEEETTLTRYQQDSVRKKLEQAGYLETKLIKANGAPTLHYKVNARLVENLLMERRETDESEKQETYQSITESTQRVLPCELQATSREENVSNSFAGETSGSTYDIATTYDDHGNPISPRKPKATTNDAKKVFKMFEEEIRVNGMGWLKNKTERQSAQTLWEEKGENKIRAALRFWADHKDETFIPEVISPYRLLNKWDSLLRFKSKNGL
jgi:hypothetical protein